uniref:Uncharacterized protein n=1 Tax=Eutreptiella gymnastica TaxID=73025 RepID=A0A7S1J6G6_9EUGL
MEAIPFITLPQDRVKSIDLSKIPNLSMEKESGMGSWRSESSMGSLHEHLEGLPSLSHAQCTAPSAKVPTTRMKKLEQRNRNCGKESPGHGLGSAWTPNPTPPTTDDSDTNQGHLGTPRPKTPRSGSQRSRTPRESQKEKDALYQKSLAVIEGLQQALDNERSAHKVTMLSLHIVENQLKGQQLLEASVVASEGPASPLSCESVQSELSPEEQLRAEQQEHQRTIHKLVAAQEAQRDLLMTAERTGHEEGPMFALESRRELAREKRAHDISVAACHHYEQAWMKEKADHDQTKIQLADVAAELEKLQDQIKAQARSVTPPVQLQVQFPDDVEAKSLVLSEAHSSPKRAAYQTVADALTKLQKAYEQKRSQVREYEHLLREHSDSTLAVRSIVGELQEELALEQEAHEWTQQLLVNHAQACDHHVAAWTKCKAELDALTKAYLKLSTDSKISQDQYAAMHRKLIALAVKVHEQEAELLKAGRTSSDATFLEVYKPQVATLEAEALEVLPKEEPWHRRFCSFFDFDD